MNTPTPTPSDEGKHLREGAAATRAFLAELGGFFGNEFILIGGWAVHAYGAKDYSPDADAMVSYEVQGTLRDAYEVNKNARLHKEQFRGPTGEDIGLYVERQHRLRVPFAELQAYCRQREGTGLIFPAFRGSPSGCVEVRWPKARGDGADRSRLDHTFGA